MILRSIPIAAWQQIAVVLLLGMASTSTTTTTTVSAWMLLQPATLQRRRTIFSSWTRPPQSHSSIGKLAPSAALLPPLHMAHSPPPSEMDDDEDEEECGEEEECEIDWSRMPGMEEDEEEDQLTPTSNSNEYADLLKSLERQFQSPSTTERTEIVEAAVTSVVGSNSGGNVPFVRSRLEMSWQLKETETECDVYLPVTCGGRQCVTCQGQGSCPCRFCRGTGQLYLPSSLHTTAFLSCRICDTTGTESCRSCQGSGWIADWTDHGVHVGGGSRPNNATVSGPSSTLQP